MLDYSSSYVENQKTWLFFNTEIEIADFCPFTFKILKFIFISRKEIFTCSEAFKRIFLSALKNLSAHFAQL